MPYTGLRLLPSMVSDYGQQWAPKPGGPSNQVVSMVINRATGPITDQ